MNVRSQRPLISLMAGLLICASLASCKSTGTGLGESPTGDVKISFMWEQSEPTSGTLTAMVMQPGGADETFRGKFYQITRDTNVETLGSLWTPFYPRWHGWAYWGPAPGEGFIEYYTGHVLANLSTPNGERMRCRFQLLRSSEGMKGGGEGQCQLPSGQTVSADFPPV